MSINPILTINSLEGAVQLATTPPDHMRCTGHSRANGGGHPRPLKASSSPTPIGDPDERAMSRPVLVKND